MIKSMQFHGFIVITALLVLSTAGSAQTYQLTSPDGDIAVQLTITDHIAYAVAFKDDTILSPSRISMTLDAGRVLGQNPAVKEVKKESLSKVLTPAVSQKSKTIQNTYNELTIDFEQSYSLIFRAYNDGIAYRFKTAVSEPVNVVTEQIEYNFPADYSIYFPQEDSFYTHQERQYEYLKLSEIGKGNFSSIPALVDVPDGPKIAITESDLIDYPGFYLQAQGNTTLKAVFPEYPKTERSRGDRDRLVTNTEDFIAKTAGSRTFPWRIRRRFRQ